MPELKSSSASGRSLNKGVLAEAQVVRLLSNKNWKLLFYRLKTRIAEIDLVFENESKILLVEVKTLNSRWRADQRLSQSQLSKLKMNRTVLTYYSKRKKVDAFVAWVEAGNIITFCKTD